MTRTPLWAISARFRVFQPDFKTFRLSTVYCVPYDPCSTPSGWHAATVTPGGELLKRVWFNPAAHRTASSLDLVRIMVALILITHPIRASMHPGDVRGFGHFLESCGFPFGVVLAWAVMLLQIVCSLALLLRKFVVPACVGHIFVLGMGILLVHAPRWRTVGLPDGDHRPGAEFSVLLIACLFAVLYAHLRKPDDGDSHLASSVATDRGLEVVRLAASLILIVHPIGGLIEAFRDPNDLNDLGLYFSSIGYPFGVFLVWAAMFFQIASSVAVALRRLVVPACFVHIYVLGTGIWLFHAPYWFAIGPDNVIGPGREGTEYSVLLITCFVSLALAYWPRQQKP
jgi:putative oxidoreductase